MAWVGDRASTCSGRHAIRLGWRILVLQRPLAVCVCVAPALLEGSQTATVTPQVCLSLLARV